MKFKFLAALTVSAPLIFVSTNPLTIDERAQPMGIDVSSYQPNVNWATVKANGLTFAFIKATEGTGLIDLTFSNHYTGATNAGLIRGAYHFAHPDVSTGADQANFFLAHGGGWTKDGITLPGALDIEYNPKGDTCYGLSHDAMLSWITSFSNTYHVATTRYPIIYTAHNWWTECTGNSPAFGNTNPLWLVANSIGDLPAGWSFTTFWQYANSGPNPGDQDLFNGDETGLKKLATG